MIILLTSPNLMAVEKTQRVDDAVKIIDQWKNLEIKELENRISKLEHVDSLRCIAFFCRAASYPENAEDIIVDEKLNRIFWACVRNLKRHDAPEAKEALRLIKSSGLLRGGDLQIFESISEK